MPYKKENIKNKLKNINLNIITKFKELLFTKVLPMEVIIGLTFLIKSNKSG